MTMTGGQFARNSNDVGHAVASYPQYEAAQKAVSRLIAEDVPAKEITIVGVGLRSLERVTGRLGYAAAARSGAINGLLLGLLFSAIFVLGTPSVPVSAFIGVLFVGIAIGMIASLLMYTIVRRRRDYASVVQFVADHYEIAVAPHSAGRARQILGSGLTPPTAPVSPPAGSAPAAPVPPVEPPAREVPAEPSAPSRPLSPPKYGQRIEEPTDAEATDGDAPTASADDSAR